MTVKYKRGLGNAIISYNDIIPKTVQKLMDDNTNCCMNCFYLKLFEGVKIFNLQDYKNLKAKCSNIEAIKEKGIRRNPIVLNTLLTNKTKISKSRMNCKFFELA